MSNTVTLFISLDVICKKCKNVFYVGKAKIYLHILIQIPGMSGYSIDVEALRTAQQQQNSSVTSNDSSQNQKSDATSSPSTESSPRYESS